MIEYDYPNYSTCLQLAGAKVLIAQEFGSYQGDFWAKVKFNGKTGWVHTYYGSCSGCDNLQAELDDCSYNKNGEYISYDSLERQEKEREVMAKIGLGMLENIYSQAEADKKASEHYWDVEAEEMTTFIRNNAITIGFDK